MACRDMKRAEKAAYKIIRSTGNRNIDVEYLDLSDLDTVRSFASKILSKYNKLDFDLSPENKIFIFIICTLLSTGVTAQLHFASMKEVVCNLS